ALSEVDATKRREELKRTVNGRSAGKVEYFCATEAVWHLDALGSPGMRVIAGYQPPWIALDTILTQLDGEEASQAVELWCRYHEHLLAWRAQFPGRCLLFNADRVDESFDELQAAVAKLIGIKPPRGRPIQSRPVAHQERARIFGFLLDRLEPRAI